MAARSLSPSAAEWIWVVALPAAPWLAAALLLHLLRTS